MDLLARRHALQSGKAYHCFCTPERLAETRKRLQREGSHEGYDRRCLGLDKAEVKERLERGERNIVRFKASVPPPLSSVSERSPDDIRECHCLQLPQQSSSGTLTQEDLIYDPIHYDSLPLEDFVLRKSDGLPTYHFANVVDDYEMGITHVLRGEVSCVSFSCLPSPRDGGIPDLTLLAFPCFRNGFPRPRSTCNCTTPLDSPDQSSRIFLCW